MTKDDIKARIARIKARITVTKVVCTRSIKGRGGDSFVGFSSAFNSVQEDGGQGLAFTGEEADATNSVTSMSLQDAVIASLILAREVDLAAYNNALAGCNIDGRYHTEATRAIKNNYAQLVMEAMGGGAPTEDTNGSGK